MTGWRSAGFFYGEAPVHEYAVTEGILAIVQEEAVKAGASRVDEIVIMIGELSTFVDESIDLYFAELSKGTVAERARLVFNRVEARADCLACKAEFRPLSALYSCPECGSPLCHLKEGSELYIDSIEAT